MLESWKSFEQRFGVPIAQAWVERDQLDHRGVRRAAAASASAGRPLPYHDLAIVDPEGGRLPPGEIGHVELGGFEDHPFRYLDEDGSVRVHSRGRIRTGDLGALDADGFLTLTGREKELIIRGGAKISPVEIDSFLMQRAEVIEPRPSACRMRSTRGSRELRGGATGTDAEELLRYCGSVLPAFKAPKQIVISASLPRPRGAKLDRRALAERWKAAGRRPHNYLRRHSFESRISTPQRNREGTEYGPPPSRGRRRQVLRGLCARHRPRRRTIQ